MTNTHDSEQLRKDAASALAYAREVALEAGRLRARIVELEAANAVRRARMARVLAPALTLRHQLRRLRPR